MEHKVERHKQVGLSCILISEGEYQDATKRINTIDKLPVMHFWDNLQPYLLDVNEDTSKNQDTFLFSFSLKVFLHPDPEAEYQNTQQKGFTLRIHDQ